MPSSTLRATWLTASQGRRSAGTASSAISLTMPVTRPSPVWVAIPPAAASCARRTASDREVLGDHDHPAGEQPGLDRGHPPAEPRLHERRAGTAPQERRDD